MILGLLGSSGLGAPFSSSGKRFLFGVVLPALALLLPAAVAVT